MKSDPTIKMLLSDPQLKKRGLTEEDINAVLDSYDEAVLKILLENGHIELRNGMVIEIVQLLDRVHVLRGIAYKSSRKYKLKLTMEEFVYKKIESYYSRLLEEIT